ncbi:dehydrogenase/reductase SDR family member 7C-B isoform X1 [Ictalurus punctatus]|uniref:Dehydrogenase/reductase SDR family member 7C-B isoform X1 n=1 Tax=Ictalurus punctatus TaxID=7998 RepID=A0A979EE19_ICTPU|nr:dehydrogenase/reductase SDR family member 7C-B isoform X1 [Ictalurus punctatus]
MDKFNSAATVLLLSVVVVVAAGIFHLYNVILQLLHKTPVQNKVVLITDSLSALGNECAKLFHKRGARLILCGKNWEKLEAFAQQLVTESDPILTFPPKLIELDFTDTEMLPDVLSDVLDCYGYLDMLIINSSMKVKAPAQSLSLEMDKMVMDVNYFGPITLAKGVLPSMISRRSGHILLVNSIQGKLAVPFRTTYAASKHAVQAFFDCLRAEVQESGISVSTISHTFINAASTTQHTTTGNSILSGKSSSSTSSHKPNKHTTPLDFSPIFSCSLKSAVLTGQKPHGISPEEMANAILQALGSKKKEIIMAHFISKAAIYARSLFPNLFFAVMAAGVKNAAGVEPVQ